MNQDKKPADTRVLIADDHRDSVLTLGILLRSEGYQVELVESGKQALLQTDRFRPHVVLLDIEMPDCSGYDVAQELNRRYGNECPVLVAVTSHDQDEDRRTAEKSGFDHFVAKPYSPWAMLKLLQGLALTASRN